MTQCREDKRFSVDLASKQDNPLATDAFGAGRIEIPDLVQSTKALLPPLRKYPPYIPVQGVITFLAFLS
jgi:hypothetical protein